MGFIGTTKVVPFQSVAFISSIVSAEVAPFQN
jgi:hypothetical protein